MMLRLRREWVLIALLMGPTMAWTQVGVHEHSDRLTVRNDRVTVELSKAHKGAITSLLDNTMRQELVALQTEPALFSLVFTKTKDLSGDTQTFSSRDAGRVSYAVERTADGERAILRFSAIGGRNIDAQCSATVKNGDTLVRWRLLVTGEEPLVLEETQFPIVVLTDTLGTSREDDVALAGATEDGQYLAPGDWGIGRQRVYTQPGSLAAQFGCYHDPSGGFYTATQDGKGYPKRLAIARVADGISFAWSHLCHQELRKPFALDYDVVSTTFRRKDKTTPTDWRDAADIHKRWALTQAWCAKTVAQRQDIPDWLKRGSMRVQWDLRADGKPKAAADWVARHWNEHFAPLPPFVTFFGFEHAGSWIAPKYVPFYPSDEAFRDATRRIRGMDGHVFLFPSSYQWTLTYNKQPDGSFQWDDHADFGQRARLHAILNRDGSVFSRPHSWLRGGESAGLCRGDAWARQFLGDTVMQLLDRGVDVVQMDQVVGGQWPAGAKSPCFSRDHGHPPGHGLWDVDAFHDQMRDLRERCDKVTPQVVFSEESPQELFVQDFGLFDYRHARANVNIKIWDLVPRTHAAVFPYLYNEFVPVFHIPSHSEPVPIILAHAIVTGEIPSFKPKQIEFPGSPVVENASFEEWSEVPVGWRVWRSQPAGTAEVGPDAKDAPVGQSALHFHGQQEGTSVQIYQCIPVDGAAVRVGGTYQVRLRMKSTGLTGTSGLDVEALDSPDWWIWKRLGNWKVDLAKDADWMEGVATFTIPQDTRILRLVLRQSGEGDVWFDDLRLEELRGDGTPCRLVRPGNAVFKMLRQWAQLAAAGAGKYVMLGEMLHPPPLRTGTTHTTVTASKASSVKFQLYILRKDHSSSVGHASCPLTVAAGEGSWEQKSLELPVRPGSAEFHVPMDLRQKGELLFDDFELTEAGSTENLMHNPGFEDWAEPAAPPPGWSHIKDYQGRTFTGTFQREAKDTHSGAFAIRLINRTDKDEIHVKQVLPVDGELLSVGKSYRLTFWVKVRNVSRRQPIRVEREFPAILHNAFRAPDGSEAAILVNITDQSQTGSLTWTGTEAKLTLSPWEIRLVPGAP